MKKALTTPVLFLAFNRPIQTARVFETIRQAKPSKLYVAVDAPREGRKDDIENNNKVKAIVEKVDWPCETHYLYQEKNLGCSKSGVTAWNWVMEREDRMIFIEDDGLGAPDAFLFVQEMLEKYKDDDRVAYVGAVNYGPKYGNTSYFFSREPSATYFMGTWKRVMDLYDYELESWRSTVTPSSIKGSCLSVAEYLVRKRQFDKYVSSIKNGKRDNTYDVQMTYLCYVYNKFSVYPNNNMVSNIGLDGGANNSVDINSAFYKEYANRATQPLGEMVHPEDVMMNTSFEREFFKKRVLHSRHWIVVLFKSYFLQYFGAFYSKYIKPLRPDR
jgi:hypothetical protein